MAMSPEQTHVLNKDWNQQPLVPLQSNWCLPSCFDKKKKATLFLAVTETATYYQSENMFETMDFIQDNPGTWLLVYEQDTEEELEHIRAMKREQGYDWYKEN